MNEDMSQIEYKSGPNFISLVIKTTLLTFVTLGIYRFWQKARLRRYYWSAVHVEGDAFEYRGTGLEAFLGFLMVIVILALYLTVIISTLYFAGLATMSNIAVVQAIATLSLLPLIYLAQYRYRQYIASRSRWRGIRFGMEKGALGFMLRGMGYFVLSIITLGLSGPFGRFQLDQYQTNRTWLGDAPFKQSGDWKQLYNYFMPYWGSVLLIVAGIALILTGEYELKEELGTDSPFIFDTVAATRGVIFITLGYILSVMFMIHYMVRSNYYLISQTQLNEAGFAPSFSTRGMVGRYLLGLLLASLVAWIAISALMVALAIIAGIIFLIISLFMPNLEWFAIFANEENVGIVSIMSIAALIIFYLAMILVTQICAEIFLRSKMIEYFATHLGITNASSLDHIAQREQDNQSDADGLGQAFDVGFGF